MKWTMRSVRVGCRCGHVELLSLDAALSRDEQPLVRQALSVRGWLRVSGAWHCPVCAARLVTCQQGLTLQTQMALVERAEATRIGVVAGVR